MHSVSNPSEKDELRVKFESAKVPHKNSHTVFLIHGRSGDLNSMTVFKHAIFNDFTNYVYFQAPFKIGDNGFSWWPEESSSLSRENFESAVEGVQEEVFKVVEKYDLDSTLLVAIGFSQGAVILSSLLHKNIDLFKGVALLSGFSVITNDMKSIMPSKKIYLYLALRDNLVNFDKAVNSYTKLFGRDFRESCHYVEEDVGHKVGIEGMRGLKNWFFNIER